ncbi:integrase [Pelomonas aquatica]|uniref:Integrase n=1 Tax=Pelomonas aquatica TaxID=431058 RepID=A0ABU1Z3V9_9BURK|nr:site-specific integrase [Pelomonas aquatica]MDR7295299.1 integrase [Pelomonas aquatica]
MTKTPTNLYRRGDVFYFRARVPKDLVKSYGREIVWVSLRTGDRPAAMRRLELKKAEFQQSLDSIRRQSEKLAAMPSFVGMVLHLTDDDIERLCLRYRAEKLAQDEIERIRGVDADEHQLELDVLEHGGLALLRQNFATGNLTEVYKSLNMFLRSIDLRLSHIAPTYRALAVKFQLAELQVYEAILKRRRGEPVDIPMSAAVQLTLNDVFLLWKRKKADRPAKTVRTFEQAFEELQAGTTANIAATLTKKDAIACRDRMLAVKSRSPRTVEKLISFLRAAFELAKREDAIPSNPFDGVEVDTTGSKARPRLPFNVDELNKIFSGSVYQPGFVPRQSLGVACYWLPLLSLFQGARLEELAQLHAEDVAHDREYGHHLFIHNEGERRVKNESSIRKVVLHPALARLGFLDYVASIKSGRLFPTIKPDKFGIIGTTYSTWFGRYLDELGITDSSRVFHSLRHSFIAQCKRKINDGIPEEVREAMVGHVSPSQIKYLYGDIYYPPEPQLKAMQVLEYKGLKLDHLWKLPPEELKPAA